MKSQLAIGTPCHRKPFSPDFHLFISESNASSSSIRPSLCCETVLEPVDPRDVIYTKTRLRIPSTDQSSRRTPHHKKCKRTANCFNGRHQAQVAPSLESTVSCQNIRRCLAEENLGSRRSLRVLPLTLIHRRLRLEWCHARGNWTAAEWNHIVFSNESKFNLSSEDNRARLWRPRGERLNPAFVYSVTSLPQLL
ncbi:uncharacterized protein TNCV_4787811 [Trichonephila clavipes]|nr:uncharacterized protein TNCV_4787811 [Trichonephila clavipes]